MDVEKFSSKSGILESRSRGLVVGIGDVQGLPEIDLPYAWIGIDAHQPSREMSDKKNESLVHRGLEPLAFALQELTSY